MTQKKAVQASIAVPEPAAAPPEVLDANRLVESLIADLPSLAPLRPLVQHVAALISYRRLGIQAEKAITFLEVAGIKQQTLKPGIDAMKKAADAEANAAAAEFLERTGRVLDALTLNPGPATKEELDEQASLKQKAIELRARVNVIRAAIFGVSKQRGKVEEWLEAARQKAEKVMYEQPGDGNVSNELPGWKTPPKLDEDNSAVKKLLQQLSLIEETKAVLRDPQATLEQLKNVKFSEATVRGVFDACDALAEAQIVQSDTVTPLAEEYRDNFVARAAKIASVRAVAKEAEDYLALKK